MAVTFAVNMEEWTYVDECVYVVVWLDVLGVMNIEATVEMFQNECE